MPGEFYIEGKKEKVDISQLVTGLAELEDKLESLVVYRGKTTADGAGDGSTLICSDLTARPDYNGNLVIIKSGAYIGQSRVINGTTSGGTVTPDAKFDGQILAGIKFAIVSIRTVEAAVAAIEAKLDNPQHGLAALKILIDTLETKGDAIKTQTDKLAGTAPLTGSATQDWQTAESDVVSIGADNTRYKLHSLLLSIHNLVGTTITVRLYMQVNGAERKVYEQAFNAATDPAGLWIVNGSVAIHEVLRVTLQSNDANDNGKAVDYDYMMEVM